MKTQIIDFQTVWNTLSPRLTTSEPVNQTIQMDPEKASLLSSHADSLDSIPAISFFSKEFSQQEESFSEIEIIGLLGEGGEGKVELAYQRSLKREVALKTSKRNEKKHQLHLLRESQIMGQLEHPNVIPVHWVGKDQEGSPRILMKKVEGISWQELLQNPVHPHWKLLFQKSKSQDPLEIQLEIFQQVLNAVEYAHSKGIVHRDIKPENIMLGNLGEVYLLDWGIAVFIEETNDPNHPMANQTVGTPCFMAPEMILGNLKEVSPATDIYLLGGTLHFVLTGQPPHRGHSMEEVLFQAFLSEPQEYSANVSTELARICNQAMQAEPTQRFQNVNELREALFLFLRNKEIQQLVEEAKEIASQIQIQIQTQQESPLEDKTKPREELNELQGQFRFVFKQISSRTQLSVEMKQLWLQIMESFLKLEWNEKNLKGAEVFWNELPPEKKWEWNEKIELLRREIEEKEKKAQQFQEYQQNNDSVLSANARGWLFLLFGIVNLSSRFIRQTDMNEKVGLDSFWLYFLQIAIGILGIFLFRKKLWTNQINQKIVLVVIALCFAWCVNILFAFFLHLSFLQRVQQELLLSSLAIFLVSILLSFPYFALLSAWLLLGVTGSFLFPSINHYWLPFVYFGAWLLLSFFSFMEKTGKWAFWYGKEKQDT